MLAPLRDYLGPREPQSSPLLCAVKDRYLSRLSVDVEPGKPGFEEARWIISEDVNAEHLLNVFASVDNGSNDVWDACAGFMRHLYWHKSRSTVLRQKIEDLADDHHSKPQCLFELSRLFHSIGNYVEQERFLVRTLELERERKNDDRVAHTLGYLADACRMLGSYGEGVQHSKEALEIYERLGDKERQARSWNSLAWLFLVDKQLDAAEEAAFRAIKQGEEYWVSDSHIVLGDVYRSKDKRREAIHHYEAALEISSRFNWRNQLFWIHHSMAKLFCYENEFGDAHSHIEQAKSHAVDDAHCLGRAMQMQAEIWYRQGRLEEAMTEALYALDTFEKLGATGDRRRCRKLLRTFEMSSGRRPLSGDLGSTGEFSGQDNTPCTRSLISHSHHALHHFPPQ